MDLEWHGSNTNTMKKILNITTALLVTVLFSQSVTAQDAGDYKNAFGIRAGGTSGLTYKHKFSGGHGMEFILGDFHGLNSFTALYEKHNSTKAAGLSWYVGGGAHFSAQRRKTYYVVYEGKDRYYYKAYSTYSPAFGIDGVLGLEYKFEKVPLAFSLDIKPNVELNRYGDAFMYLDPGLGIKVAF
jgi:hypothetical protein